MDVSDYNRAGNIATVWAVWPPYRNLRCQDCGAHFYADFWGWGFTHACPAALKKFVAAGVQESLSKMKANQ